MNGRVIEIEYAKGWGRVLLEDGRLMTFDTAACMEGIPDADAQVTVTLVPARLGGEKIGRITVRESWTALPDDVPYLIGVAQMLIVRDGAVVQSPVGVNERRLPGETGYAIFEAKRGLVSHTAAWSSSSEGTGSRDLRVRSLHPSGLRADELALFKAYVDTCIADLKDELDDAEGEDDDSVRAVGDELIATIKLANRLRGHRQRRPSN